MSVKRPKIGEVFTPRSSEVNPRIYIDRPDHEKELKRTLEGSFHPLIFGHSGSGKSWLYKKVLKDEKAYYSVANCANAARYGSLVEEISRSVLPNDRKELTSLSEEIHAEGSAVIAKGGARSSRVYEILKEDPLHASFHYMSKKAKGRSCVLVIDNLEAILESQSISEELANIITLSDDSRYAKYNIKILIVGVPSGVLEYFSKTKNLPTVANRIRELTEVRGLNRPQVFELVRRGFSELLKANFSEVKLREVQTHVHKVSLGIPLRVHEYCELLAFEYKDSNWNAKKEAFEKADIDMMKHGLRESYHVVESLMNKKETKVGRRNQVLYALGQKVTGHYFSAEEIEKTLRIEFPNSTKGVSLGVHQLLVDITKKENTIISRGKTYSTFQIKDPRYIMILRLMLDKDEQAEKVKKKAFKV